jgi:class 3 adenylate cyclase
MDAKEFRVLAEKHAPKAWIKKTKSDEGLEKCALVKSVVQRASVETIVLCVDIRSSTILMREALNHHQYANIITSFVSAAKSYIQNLNGWFDKFTGDGFLAYWPTSEEEIQKNASHVSQFCRDTIRLFMGKISDDLRANSRNFPKRAGLSIGVDAGPLNLLSVADDLTIVGHPVVGAVRMVGMAEPYELIANVAVGNALSINPSFLTELGFKGMDRLCKASKEYPDGQEVYRLIM